MCASSRTPPPTVSGMKTSLATASTTWTRVSRAFDEDAEPSRSFGPGSDTAGLSTRRRCGTGHGRRPERPSGAGNPLRAPRWPDVDLSRHGPGHFRVPGETARTRLPAPASCTGHVPRMASRDGNKIQCRKSGPDEHRLPSTRPRYKRPWGLPPGRFAPSFPIHAAGRGAMAARSRTSDNPRGATVNPDHAHPPAMQALSLRTTRQVRAARTSLQSGSLASHSRYSP